MFPVESLIPAIRVSLAANRDVVLRAPPGSGKTTCVPPALLDMPFLKGRKVLMLEPRRLAARACASFMARRMGEVVGGTVGYAVRLERRVSERTRLEIVTKGLLAQRLLNDLELSDVGMVVFDEFHERSLACDLGFAMALDVRRVLRPDLRIMVMSATLDTESVARHLGDADVHTAEAPMFPVETKYLVDEPRGPVAFTAAAAVKRALSVPGGDILVFLPGEGEIMRCAEELSNVPAEIFPLYGALPKERQDAALAPASGRKVVLATSIAETSLTIPGITVVIDSGLMRISRFSPRTGMSRLETLRLTRDRADQRRGRAGRVAPGVCHRLRTLREDCLLQPAMKPEILEADLAPTVLVAALWGTTRLDGLPWLTSPPEPAWNSACALLRQLGALDADSRITSRGKAMARLSAHPRLANMMLSAPGLDACLLAAVLEELPNGGPRRETDLRRIIDLVRECPGDRFSRRVMELARRWRRQLPSVPDETAAGTVVALAFPDRIGKNRGNGTFQLTGGGGAQFERTESLATSEYLVCCELNDAGGDARIHLASPIGEDDIEALFADAIVESTETEWDRRTEAVKAVCVRRLGRMAIRSGGQPSPDAYAVQRALFTGIRQKGVANLPCWSPALRQLQARICFLHRTFGGWPDVSDASLEVHLEEWFAAFTTGMSRWTHLEKLDLAAVLDMALLESGCDRRTLDRLAPVKMEVPSGSQMAIHYEEAEPFMQVRLQECFGLMETPRVAGGQVPVVMKLLSPAQRPVQITKDLASFWENGYPLVRKDLRGRYPKHYWPEDPRVAVATRRVRPR